MNCSSSSPVVAVDSWAWLTRRSGGMQWSPYMGGVLPPARCSAVKAAWVKIEESKSRISRWIWAVISQSNDPIGRTWGMLQFPP